MGDESRFRYRRDDGAAERVMRERSAPASSGGGDPLAELARLIGDNDPFDDFSDMPPQQAPQRQLTAPRPAAVPQPAHADPRQAQRAPAYAAPAARQPAAQPAAYYEEDDADDDATDWAPAPQAAPAAARYASAPARVAPSSPAYRTQTEASSPYPTQDGTVRLGYGSLARTMPARPQPAVVDDEDDYEDDVPARPAATQARGGQSYASQGYAAPQAYADDDDDDHTYDDRAAYGRGQDPRQGAAARPAEPRYGEARPADARYEDARAYGTRRDDRDDEDDDQAAYAYSAPRRDDDAYDDYDDAYDPEYADEGYMPPHGEDIYDQEPRRRRGRMALLLGVSILGLLVAGAAGVFAYNMAVGKHAMSASGSPPVIKADAGSSKTVNPTPPPADPQQKLIYDRLGGNTTAANERVVPREEQPVDVTAAVSKSYAAAPDAGAPSQPAPSAQAQASTQAQVSAAGAPSLNEPKKVRTLAVRADSAAPAVSASPVTAYAANPASSLPDPASAATAAAAQNAGASNATAMPTPLANGAYVVQVASQRTEADANGSWRALQQKYPNILGSYRASVKKADLGDRGIFFRAQVGPFATRDQANQLCQALHAQGGDCIVAKN